MESRRTAGIIRVVTNRRWTLVAVAVITPLGFLTKHYTGPASGWVNNSLGGVLYVIFWSLLISLFRG